MRKIKIPIHISGGFYALIAFSVLLLPLNWVVAWLLATVVHEAGHLIVGKLCGASVMGIQITPIGARIESQGLVGGREILALLAGPMAGFLLLFTSKWIPRTAVVASIQSAFNLLPLANLDGGNILRSLLCQKYPESVVARICALTDRVVRLTLFCSGLWCAWKLSWGMGVLIFCLLIVRLFVRRKTPCKQTPLRVE